MAFLTWSRIDVRVHVSSSAAGGALAVLIMSESTCLRDGSAHCDRGRVVGPRIGAGAAPSPIGETVAASRRGTDRNSCSAIFPSTSRTHCATGSVAHRQIILGAEVRCVSRVGGRRDSV